ncbi:MAG: SPOR domain-containing protein [Rhodoferax sp.]|uniref:SPOR domain-containing protein n=1 Tax=Rhodoferax sp. TaxID=50421 RepID=UPI0030160051
MAFFKFRKSGDEASSTPVQPESVEGMRKRAKHRLIGAAVLVLVGVIGLPMLFDKQPRPISVDTPIEIPDKNKAKPLSIPAPAAIDTAKPEAVAPVTPAAPVVEAAVPKFEEKAPVAPVLPAQVAAKNIAAPEPKVIEKPTDKPVQLAKPVVKVDEGAKAQALLDGKSLDKKPDAAEGRFVVQVGAFADATRAREVRLKVEHAGLKTYTHVAQTKEGSRIRVRVGPFATRAEAEKAAEKIKKLALPAAILTL